ncbi:MAG: hypothetical protein MJE12_09080 [Alphaproteobacteria bacterium]|nr:hypothetical protein [Alphaproteobacteria bacterium]
MKKIFLIAAMMVVGFMGGLFYAHLVGPPVTSTAVVTVSEEPAKSEKVISKPAAASISRVQKLRMQRKAMRHSAEQFFAGLDEGECNLDPANLQLYADDARYTMRYRLPDGEEKSFELDAASFKSFGIGAVRELALSGLECSSQGRFYQVEDGRVRVHEQRTLEAMYHGDTVEIRQERTLIIGPSNDGDWVIHEITGIGVIR